VALFPGLVYSRADYRRMAGYPKVDKGNPYLVAAFTGHVVDSLPWGRGWMAPQVRSPQMRVRIEPDQLRPGRPALLARAARESGGGEGRGGTRGISAGAPRL
jgi:hypothetical protein